MKEKLFISGRCYNKIYLCKITAAILVSMMLVSLFVGCKKDEVSETTAGKSATATSTAAKKTTAASSSSSATASSKATGTAEATQGKVSERENSATGNINNTDRNDNAEEEEEEEERDSSAGTEPAEQSKTFDLKGRVLKLVTHSTSLGYPIADLETRTNQVMYQLMKEAEEKFNCKFEFELVANENIIRTNFESSSLAGIYYADAVRITRQYAMPRYEKSNMILPLNVYIDFNQPVYKQYDQVNGVIYPDKIYSFYILGIQSPRMLYYNKAIFEREGLPDLHVLNEQGNWNWNTFLNIAIKATKDMDGDGIVDQWGVGASNAQEMCISMLYSNLAAIVDRSDEGYVYNLQNPKALRALQFTSDLYHTYKVIPNKNLGTDFKKGNVAMLMVTSASSGKSLFKNGVTHIGCEVLPYGPDNPGNAYMREQGAHMYFYPNNMENPEAVINAMAWWQVAWDESKSDYLTFDDMNLSSSQTYFTLATEPEVEINYYMNLIRNANLVYDYVQYFTAADTEIKTKVFNEIAAKQISPVSNIDALKYQVKDIIAEVMGY